MFQAAKDELAQLAADDDPRPWALMIGAILPHFPYTISRPYYERYECAEIPAPREVVGHLLLDQAGRVGAVRGGRHDLQAGPDPAAQRVEILRVAARQLLVSGIGHAEGGLVLPAGDPLPRVGLREKSGVGAAFPGLADLGRKKGGQGEEDQAQGDQNAHPNRLTPLKRTRRSADGGLMGRLLALE